MKILLRFQLGLDTKSVKNSNSDKVTNWLSFLAYLAYLRAMRPEQPPERRVLRLLILMMGFVLVAVTLTITGAPEKIIELLQYWPFIP